MISHPFVMNTPPGWRPGNLIPGRGNQRCFGCHRPWWVVRQRNYRMVPTGNAGSSMFAMCSHY